MKIKHTFVSQKQDSSDTTIVRPSDWNAYHTIEGGSIWELIYEADLANNSDRIISGLNEANDRMYKVVLSGTFNPGATAKYVLLRPNGDTASGNYTGVMHFAGEYLTGNFYTRVSASNVIGLGLATSLNVNETADFISESLIRRASNRVLINTRTSMFRSGGSSVVGFLMNSWNNANSITSFTLRLGDMASFSGNIRLFALR